MSDFLVTDLEQFNTSTKVKCNVTFVEINGAEKNIWKGNLSCGVVTLQDRDDKETTTNQQTECAESLISVVNALHLQKHVCIWLHQVIYFSTL